MFAKEIYIQRRNNFKKNLKKGIVLLLGNTHVPMNYPANCYHFRQDSNFLYFFGLDYPGMAAIIDIDNDHDHVFGQPGSLDDLVWTGPQPTLQEKAEMAGVNNAFEIKVLQKILDDASRVQRPIHFLPPYRAENQLMLYRLLDITPQEQKLKASVPLIMEVVRQRSVKESYEIEQIEQAAEIGRAMQTTAMKMAKGGTLESEIAAAIESIAISKGSHLSFPAIVTKNGQILHNHFHGNQLQNGNLLLVDAGAESPMHYASDHTRTIPVGGRFAPRQKDIYQIVLEAQNNAINAIKPGVSNKTVHLIAARAITDGLKGLGLMKGDTEIAVENGAHSLFFPHGIGHMLGLDVHDMEDLGENFVGYDEEIKRSENPGIKSLRFGRRYQPGFVITVEPGCYFIPPLIEKWRSEKKFTEYINYDKVADYADFGGIRIEDDILVTGTGHRILGNPIPKTVKEIEDYSNT